MASAWEQLGGSNGINQMRRQAQLGRSVNAVYYTKNFKRSLPNAAKNHCCCARAYRYQDAKTNTARCSLKELLIPHAPYRAVSAPLRRMASPRNLINTRFRSVGKLSS